MAPSKSPERAYFTVIFDYNKDDRAKAPQTGLVKSLKWPFSSTKKPRAQTSPRRPARTPTKTNKSVDRTPATPSKSRAPSTPARTVQSPVVAVTTPRRSTRSPARAVQSPVVAVSSPRRSARSTAMTPTPPRDSTRGPHQKKAREYPLVVCMFCEDAFKQNKIKEIKIIEGRSLHLKLHLSKCAFAESYRNGTQVSWPLVPWTTDLVKELHRLLLDVLADADLPASFVERATVLKLVNKLNPAVTPHWPGRKKISGSILREVAKECSERDEKQLKTLQDTYGARVNLLSDGWQNIAKKHVLGWQLSLFGCIFTGNLQDPGTKHDALALSVLMDRLIKEAQSKGFVVGGVATDDAGQCAKARRVLIRRYPAIVFLRCFAHDINNLVKEVLRSTFAAIARKASAAVTFLNSASSTWLVHAKASMARRYHKKLSFVPLCETRWNSMQECFASLLRVRGALVNLANEYKSVGLPSEIAVFLEPTFWSELEEAEAVISPLSQASYRLQRDENTVADVLVSFRDIYFGFASNESYGHNLVRSVERRWAKCEQPLFLLGLFLHPELRADAKILMAALKDRNVHIDLIAEDCAVYYYRRFHGEDYGKLRVEFEAWLQLKELQVRLTDYDKPAPSYWKYAKRFYPALAKLATTILSVAVNTASCERLFSSLGAIHSATRSKLAAEKAMQFHVVKKRVRDDADSQQPPKKKKMRISEPAELTVKFAEALAEPADVQSDEDDSDEETTGHHVETFLHLQLALEAIFEDDDIASEYERCGTSTNYSPYEPIPRPDMRPFDHPEFRQESKIIGFRAWSMSLSELFPLSSRSQYNRVEDESDSGSEWSCESPL